MNSFFYHEFSTQQRNHVILATRQSLRTMYHMMHYFFHIWILFYIFAKTYSILSDNYVPLYKYLDSDPLVKKILQGLYIPE